MKAATLPLFRLAPLEVTTETVEMAAGKTPPFEGMTPGKPVQVFPMGAARTVDGRKVQCEAEDFRLLLGDLATRKNPVTLTVEHEMDPLWGSRAAGECSEFLQQGDGLWGLDPHWTEPALGEIRSGARRWISPTFYATEDENGNVRPRILRDVSLVSVPNLDGMQPVTASASREAAATSQPNSPSKASERKEQETMKLSADTLKLLGLADGASLEDIDKAVVKLAAEKPDVKALVREEMAAERTAIRAEVKAEMAAEAAKNACASRVSSLLERCSAEGKLVADNKEALAALCAADPDAFEKVLPGLQILAPVRKWFQTSKQGAEGGKTPLQSLNDPDASRDVAARAVALAAEKNIPYLEALDSLVVA